MADYLQNTSLDVGAADATQNVASAPLEGTKSVAATAPPASNSNGSEGDPEAQEKSQVEVTIEKPAGPATKPLFDEALHKFLEKGIHNVTEEWARKPTTHYWLIRADSADLARNKARTRLTENREWQAADLYIRKEKDGTASSIGVGSWILHGKGEKYGLVLQVRREHSLGKNRPTAVIFCVRNVQFDSPLELDTKSVSIEDLKVVGLDRARQPVTVELPTPITADRTKMQELFGQFIEEERKEKSVEPSVLSTPISRRPTTLTATTSIFAQIENTPAVSRLRRGVRQPQSLADKSITTKERKRKRTPAKTKRKAQPEFDSDESSQGGIEEQDDGAQSCDDDIPQSPPLKQSKTTSSSDKKTSPPTKIKTHAKPSQKVANTSLSQDRGDLDLETLSSNILDDENEEAELFSGPQVLRGCLANITNIGPRTPPVVPAGGYRKQVSRGAENRGADRLPASAVMQMQNLDVQIAQELEYQKLMQMSQMKISHLQHMKQQILLTYGHGK